MLGGYDHGRGVEGELTGAGTHEEAADANVVAEIEELVEVEEILADVIFADVDLEALAVLLDLREASFTLDADRHDATGDGGFDVHALEVLGGEMLAERAELWYGGGEGEAVGILGLVGRERRIGGAGEGGDLVELFAAQLVEVFFEGTVVLGHGAARFRLDVEVSV